MLLQALPQDSGVQFLSDHHYSGRSLLLVGPGDPRRLDVEILVHALNHVLLLAAFDGGTAFEAINCSILRQNGLLPHQEREPAGQGFKRHNAGDFE